ncbi:MAG: prephenate dehydrogenase [Planctomycetota bacterium]|nr:prephenate dehydrogenase [Planctomycetota bacterium]
MVWQRVSIVGVGLLGGSIGLRLKQAKLATEVIGIGRNPERLEAALAKGAIDSYVLRDAEDWPQKLVGSDLIIVCTPVLEIVPVVEQIVKKIGTDATITDVGSTKSEIMTRLGGHAAELCFVGSHPIAGSEKSGVGSATADLLEGKLVLMTSSPNNAVKHVENVSAFWRSLGAFVQEISAADHDSILATTSHLPHVVASILAGATPRNWLSMTGTGWADSTRIASGSPIVWRQILEENHGPVLHAIDNFATILGDWSEALRARDFDKIEQLLNVGKKIRDALGNRHSSG